MVLGKMYFAHLQLLEAVFCAALQAGRFAVVDFYH